MSFEVYRCPKEYFFVNGEELPIRSKIEDNLMKIKEKMIEI